MKTKMWQIGLAVSVLVLSGLAGPAFGQIYVAQMGTAGDGQTLTIPQGTYKQVYFPAGCLAVDSPIPPWYDITMTFTGTANITLYGYDRYGIRQSASFAWGFGGGASFDLYSYPGLSGGVDGFWIYAYSGDVVLDEIRADNYTCANAPPVAVDDAVLTQINTAAAVDVLANDSDPDEDPLSISEFTQGAGGVVTAHETVAGVLIYTPTADFAGTDSFTYTVSDGVATDTATVTVTVNRPPVAAPDAADTDLNVPVTIVVLENDLDADGDALTVTSVGAAASGSVTLNSDGTVTYTPNVNFAGQDEFFYTISDGKGGTSTAEVGIVVNPMHVPIDIKPGSYPNSINCGANGVVPVAILSMAGFDATTVDPATVSLAGATVAMRGKGNRLMAGNQDVNADGLLDLVLQVETENLDPEQLQDGSGTIVGTTYGGVPIIGSDEITLVPPQ